MSKIGAGVYSLLEISKINHMIVHKAENLKISKLL